MNRNKEGYMDKTACEAIRRADKEACRYRKKKNSVPKLTYFIAEVSGFYEIVSTLQR